MESDKGSFSADLLVKVAGIVVTTLLTAFISGKVFFDMGHRVAEAEARAREAERPNAAKEMQLKLEMLQENIKSLQEKIHEKNSSLSDWENAYNLQKQRLDEISKSLVSKNKQCSIYEEINKTREQIDSLRSYRNNSNNEETKARLNGDMSVLETRLSQFIQQLSL